MNKNIKNIEGVYIDINSVTSIEPSRELWLDNKPRHGIKINTTGGTIVIPVMSKNVTIQKNMQENIAEQIWGEYLTSNHKVNNNE